MYRKALLLIFIITLTVTAGAVTEKVNYSGKNSKIGILDIEQVMAETRVVDLVMNKITKKYASQAKTLAKEEKILEGEIEKYNKILNKLNPREVKQWQHKINALQNNLQREQAILQDKIVADQEIATEKIISYFFGLVTKIAERYGFDIVFFQDVTVMSHNSPNVRDITEEIIKLSRKETQS